MATYKVIQDIEAEDKFIGPLSLKQFIFAAGAVFASYLSFFAVIKGAYFMLVFTLPPALVGYFLAVPWSKDQPTEVWVLAKLRFYFKPRKRVWNQDGIQELVTITAPKKVEKHLTNELSQTQVKSRLKALADTIDTRGWAVKNSALQPHAIAQTDRLVSANILPQQVAPLDDLDDPLDESTSLVATNLNQMIQTTAEDRKKQLLQKMEQARNPSPPPASATVPLPTPAPVQQNYSIPNPVNVGAPTQMEPSEKALSEQLKTSSRQNDISTSRMHSIPAKANTVAPTDAKKAQAPTKDTASADIINLSQNNDLNVATLARQAGHEDDSNEVVISLH